jgi:urease accessory protein
MSWNAQLKLNYSRQDAHTVLHFDNEGPLRTFRSIYPEGPSICHNVIVHPPGGLVAGDVLNIHVRVQSQAHALVSTPGATRFYRSEGAEATQHIHIQLEPHARLEWMPLESITYPDCKARNWVDMQLAPGAQVLAWDVMALGLPAAGQTFESGSMHQRMKLNDVWLDQGHIDATDTVLMDSPTGMAGHRCMGTLVLGSGSPMSRTDKETWLDAVRSVLPQELQPVAAAATCPNDHVLVVRVMGPVVEPVMQVLQQAWTQLREAAWGLAAPTPRIWSV